MADGQVAERGVLAADDEAWERVARQAAVIGPLARLDVIGLAQADVAANELGISRRQVYTLLERWRGGQGMATDLLPGASAGGRGKGRLATETERVVEEVLRTRYMTRQRLTRSAVHREIVIRCRALGLVAPSRGAVDRRIARLEPVAAALAREGRDAADRLRAFAGTPPEITRALQRVQVDHTPVDVVVVDERERLPIGRPFLSVAIDVASRCVVGMLVSLEAPSALSVGLVLTHTVTDKRAWLEGLGAAAVWPMSGRPQELYLDNAAEFKSQALARGAGQYGIALEYRPKGLKHFGGIVERLIGTMMRLSHELPGTTFSNTAERGAYDCDGRAVMTLRELERWFALAVACYHGEVHATLGRTPAGMWAQLTEHQAPATVVNATAFLIDFLPVLRRRVRRDGFVVDYVHYYSDALRPFIARRGQLGKFVLRRDPRDISRIWVLDPGGGAYIEVPYRTLSRPPISLWEQKAAVARLRELGRGEVDENALFAMAAQMREVVEGAGKSTRRARRDRQRRAEVPEPGPLPPLVPPSDQAAPGEVAAPFEVIEQW